MKPKHLKRTTPRIALTDPRFDYVPAKDTDLAKTFAKARERLAEEQRFRELPEGTSARFA